LISFRKTHCDNQKNVMKELFRERDFTRVAYFRGVLENLGIATIIRNEYLTCSGLAEIPIPEFFPALCVMDDTDYERAVVIVREHLQSQKSSLVDEEKPCAACGEMNPGNFETCWSCGHLFEGS